MLVVPAKPIQIPAMRDLAPAISTTLSGFPTEVTNIVTGYLTPDDALAIKPLAFNSLGEVTNPDVLAAIKEALISSDFRSQIKSKIFDNLIHYTPPDSSLETLRLCLFDRYNNRIATLIGEAADEGYRINLDYSHIVGNVLRKLWLMWTRAPYISARHAYFSNVTFYNCSFTEGDFHGATFNNCTFQVVDLTGVNATGVTHINSTFSECSIGHMCSDDPGLQQLIKVALKNARSGFPVKLSTDLLKNVLGSESYSTPQPVRPVPALTSPHTTQIPLAAQSGQGSAGTAMTASKKRKQIEQ